MTNLAAILFVMSFIYCKTTSNPLFSTFVNKMMINYHSLCYFCEIVSHFGFYPPKKPPMNIQSNFCVASPDLIQDRGRKIFW